jgi:hypothetical protein
MADNDDIGRRLADNNRKAWERRREKFFAEDCEDSSDDNSASEGNLGKKPNEVVVVDEDGFKVPSVLTAGMTPVDIRSGTQSTNQVPVHTP